MRSILARILERLYRRVTGTDFFNRDASIEIDRLIAEAESLREQLREAENA